MALHSGTVESSLTILHTQHKKEADNAHTVRELSSSVSYKRREKAHPHPLFSQYTTHVALRVDGSAAIYEQFDDLSVAIPNGIVKSSHMSLHKRHKKEAEHTQTVKQLSSFVG